MDDMISKISELLSDPAQAENIKKIAESLSGVDNNKVETNFADNLSKKSVVDSVSVEDSDKMFSSLLGSVSTESMTRNIALLNAITPYLRPSRASKIAYAIKAIRIIDALSKVR